MVRHWLALTLSPPHNATQSTLNPQPAIATQFEISQTQQCVGIGERPSPIAALAFQAAEAGDFLQQQGVPVAIGGQRFDAKAALRQPLQ